MKLNEHINRIKEVMGINLIQEGEKNIDNFTVDLENGPNNHKKRALGNWQSDNAWDLFAPEGTVVNSYTNGVVSMVYDNGKKSGPVYGTQVSIKGKGDSPDIFYTHLKNVKIRKGDSVKVGDYIGEISEWCTDDTCSTKTKGTHVHIGLPYGNHLRDLLNNEDKIFSKNDTTKNTSDNSNNIVDKVLKDMISGILGTK
jgi:hypothetical protein